MRRLKIQMRLKRESGQARNTFNKMKNAFCSRDISLNTYMRLLRCYVFSTLLHGMKAWTFEKKDMHSLEAFEM